MSSRRFDRAGRSVLKAVALLPANRPCRLLGHVLRLPAELTEVDWFDDREKRLNATIIAGVERLFRGGSVKKTRSGRSETRLAAAATAPGSKVHIDIGTWTQHIVDSLARRPRVGKNLQIYSADFSSVSRNACAMISYSIHELRNCSAIRERRGTLSVRPGAPWWGVGSETQFTCEPGGGQWLLRASSATKG